MKRPALLAALAAAAAALAWLDGWVELPSRRPARSEPPADLRRAVSAAAEELAARARSLAENPEVARSLEGGGIAVQRERLFASARQAVEGAAPGTWIALADPRGNPQAWWGDAPSRIPQVRAPGTLEVRWSATRMELVHWSLAGKDPYAGVVCAGRALPVQAPDFARALGLSGDASDWEPVAPGGKAPVLLDVSGGAPLLAGRHVGLPERLDTRSRALALALVLALGLGLVVGGGDALAIGVGLSIAFLAAEAFAGSAERALAAPRPWLLAAGLFLLPAGLVRLRSAGTGRPRRRLAAGYGLFICAIAAASGTVLPDLGARLPMWSTRFLELVALTALTASALAIGASAGPRSGRGAWTGIAVGLTSLGILSALLLVSPSRAYPIFVAVGSVAAYEAWRRAIAAAPESGPLGPFRLAAGMTLLLILLAAPVHAHRRLVRRLRCGEGDPATRSGEVLAGRRRRRAAGRGACGALRPGGAAAGAARRGGPLRSRLPPLASRRGRGAVGDAHRVRGLRPRGPPAKPLLAHPRGRHGRPGRSGGSAHRKAPRRAGRAAGGPLRRRRSPGARRSCRWPTGRTGTRCRPGSRSIAGSSALPRRFCRRPVPSSSSTDRTALAARKGRTSPQRLSTGSGARARPSACALRVSGRDAVRRAAAEAGRLSARGDPGAGLPAAAPDGRAPAAGGRDPLRARRADRPRSVPSSPAEACATCGRPARARSGAASSRSSSCPS